MRIIRRDLNPSSCPRLRPRTRASLPAAAILLAAALPVAGQEAAASAPERRFEVTASRFRFEPALLEVQEGERVVLTLRSADVTHGFALKEFGVETAVPEGGAPVTVEFVASRPGRFRFECSEFCGEGHPDMAGELVVLPAGGGAAPPPIPERRAWRADPPEPDFAVVNLPTALGPGRGGVVFRILHRFSRPLGLGDFGDLAGDLFGFDSGGDVGLELRYGIADGTQAGVYRTSGDRTIVLFAQHELADQERLPLGLSVLASVEAFDNFQEEHAARVGVLLSGRFGDRVALYALPSWVGNTNLPNTEGDADDYTLVLGLGARLRLFGAVSVTAEAHPRLGGFDPGGTVAGFGIERAVGRHNFQINVVNDQGTTPVQVARGRRTDSWFVGFNISRRF